MAASLAVLSMSALSVAAGCGDGEEPIDADVSTTTMTDESSTPTTPDITEPLPSTAPDTSTGPDAEDGRGIDPGDELPAPDPSTLPEATAPAGLGSVDLPDDADGVAALFALLPEELLGASRELLIASPGMVAARYDPGDLECTEVGLQAIDLTSNEGGFYPDDWRAENVVALFASGADWDVEEAGREATLYWVTFENYCGGEHMGDDEIISSATWGEADSDWVFFLGASNPADRNTLITAFVDAASQTTP